MIDVVLIKWVDAASRGGWRSLKELRTFALGELDPVVTVGMMVREDEDKVVLIQTFGMNAVIGMFEIPKGCIVSREVLGKIEREIEL